MFGFFKKKKKELSLYAVCDGCVKNIDKVNDPVFADKIMGDGYAIAPEKGKISVSSPVKGRVMSVFPTKHAITFLTDEGVESLIHMGIDTVALNGEGFSVFVKEGDTVDANTIIAEMDVDYITSQGKDTDIIIVFTNLENAQHVELTATSDVKRSQAIGLIPLN